MARLWQGLVVVAGLVGASATPGVSAERFPAGPGTLIVAGAEDSTRGFRWASDAESGRRVLYWPGGYLVVTDSVRVARHGADDIAVAYDGNLRGYSEGRSLLFADGRFVIRRPLLLTDGERQLFAARGELEVGPTRLVYRDRPTATASRSGEPAQWLMFGGFLILVVVLMLRSRSALRRR